MFVFALTANVLYLNRHESSVSDFLMQAVPQIFILTAFLIIICYEKGDAPYWRWGKGKEEMLDVYDENGENAGRVAARSIVHRDGLWHNNAHVYVFNSKGEVLLQKRSAEKTSNPNMWGGSAGGHVEAGDNSFDAAIRETHEEIGLSVSDPEVRYIGTSRDSVVLNGGTYKNNQFNDVYVIKKDVAISDLKKQDSEVSEIKWIPIEEFRKRTADKDATIVPCASIPLFFTYYDNLK